MGELDGLETDGDRKKVVASLFQLRRTLMECDLDGDGLISFQEFEHLLRSDANVGETLESMGVPADDVTELFRVLDHRNVGQITAIDFMEICSKVQGALPSKWDVEAAHSGVKGLLRYTSDLSKEVTSLTQEQEKLRVQQGSFQEEVIARLTKQ